jgi:hypothetical protein
MSSFPRLRAGAIAALLTLFIAPSAFAASPVHISNNWAGQEAVGGTYTGVSATWTVPSSSRPRTRLSAHAEWVGVGGAQTSDLIQAGTQAIVTNGKTRYVAWYETLPDTQRQLPIEVSAGDTVFVSLKETAPDVWHLTFVNRTTGSLYTTDINYHSSHSSAEWIIERPLVTKGKKESYLKLNDFDTITFNQAQAIENGVEKPLATLDTEKILLKGTSSSSVSAVPTDIEDGSFTIDYYTISEGRSYMKSFRKLYRLGSAAPKQETLHAQTTIIPVEGTTVFTITF